MELTEEEAAAAQFEQEKHTSDDPRLGIVEQYLNTPIPDDWAKRTLFERQQYYQSMEAFKSAADDAESDIPVGSLRTKVCAMEVWTECLQQSEARLLKSETRQISSILEKLGWEKSDAVMRFGPYGVQRGYVKKRTSKKGGLK